MKTVLVISSVVAASRVGATASAFCLRRLGCEAVVLPTTVFGRHPGWGAPGGTRTPPELLRSIWDGIAAQDIRFDAILSGYMGGTEHVALAADIISTARVKNPDLHVLVDPVMGDHGKLYIDEPVAEAIKTTLVPLATIITPNVWELSYLTGQTATSLDAIARVARTLPCNSLITSVPDGEQIGVMMTESARSHILSHAKFDDVPNGGGDSLAGTYLAHRLSGRSGPDAAAHATASIFEIIKSAQNQSGFRGELPLVHAQNALINTPPLKITALPFTGQTA